MNNNINLVQSQCEECGEYCLVYPDTKLCGDCKKELDLFMNSSSKR